MNDIAPLLIVIFAVIGVVMLIVVKIKKSADKGQLRVGKPPREGIFSYERVKVVEMGKAPASEGPDTSYVAVTVATGSSLSDVKQFNVLVGYGHRLPCVEALSREGVPDADAMSIMME